MNPALVQKIIKRISALNSKISEDSHLGPAYRIGHSFFCPSGTDFSHLDDKWYREVVETELRPLLLEYWYDAADEAQSAADHLLMRTINPSSKDIIAAGIPVQNAWYLLLYASDLAVYRSIWNAESEQAPRLLGLLAHILCDSAPICSGASCGALFPINRNPYVESGDA